MCIGGDKLQEQSNTEGGASLIAHRNKSTLHLTLEDNVITYVI